ncbi:hypothetical protein [Clostridium lacusfryxellense]|uniref:hypothetical protein n=1 Tax=Clostridium lacusfryxellense TaxID=205328 RepID=UPI001C0CD0B5|nr:hypothetical protein [Clostridium lacusfryxellense]MBU3113998.1 hypothetical protein [Clostridium lacusfryxellense]
MREEELLYNVIFPEDDDPNFINYGYFIGRNKRSIYKLKATINDSQLNPIIICDGNKENAFFAKVFQNEVDRFLKIINEFSFKQIKIDTQYMNEIKYLFGEEVIIHQKKAYKAAHCQYPLRANNGMINWKLGDIVASNLKCENKPNIKRAI